MGDNLITHSSMNHSVSTHSLMEYDYLIKFLALGNCYRTKVNINEIEINSKYIDIMRLF